MNKKTIKFITQPIWEPIILIGKGIKEYLKGINKYLFDAFIKNLKDEDGGAAWLTFLAFSYMTTMFIMLTVGHLVSITAASITSIVIIFPVYLAIYYFRTYFKNKE